MPRIALAVLFVFLVGAVRVLAPTPSYVRPPSLSVPASALTPPPGSATPMQPAPSRPARPRRSMPRPSSDPHPPASPQAASIITRAAPFAPLVATTRTEAPLISASLFHLSPVPPLPPPPRSIASGARSYRRGDFTAPKRPAPLLPLYGSFAALQALDYHSTRRALENGSGREANPLMRTIVKSPPAFMAVKAAATASVIVAGEKMWKKNRVAAVLFVAGANVALGIVVAKNYDRRK